MAKNKIIAVLGDWRSILIFVIIIGGLVGLILWGGDISPIDKHMRSKGGTGFSSRSSASTDVPKEDYARVGNIGPSNFAWVDKKYVGNLTALRSIGAAICSEQSAQKEQDYCEVYFWTNKAEIVVEMPLRRSPSLIGEYEDKDGKQKLKTM